MRMRMVHQNGDVELIERASAWELNYDSAWTRRDVHAVPPQVAKLVKDGHAKTMGKNARGEMTYRLISKEGEE